jgi:hypothetical protein
MKLPPRARNNLAERTRFLIRYAALFHNPSGHLSELSLACGLSVSVLSTCLTRGRISASCAQRIADCIGPENFPIHLLTAR